jgi:hypothetical protein
MLATTIHWSVFGTKDADRIMREDGDWQDLLRRIATSGPHPSKATCPWVKMARFGDIRTAKNSLRCNENVQEIYGVEGDYDDEVMQPEEAIAKLEAAHIKAVVYTSPSHTPERPRWRVLVPVSQPHKPHERYALLARVNGVLGGVLSGESFTLSQSYYFGRVVSAAEYKVLVTFDDPEEGHCIDQLTELDQIAIGKKEEERRAEADPSDPRWGESELAVKVRALGRKLRTGDGRHFALVRAANSLSAQGVRNVETVGLTLEALVQKYFDPADPPAHGALHSIAQHAVQRDQRKQSEAAEMAEALLSNYRTKTVVDPDTGEIKDELPSIDDVQVWSEDSHLPVPQHLKVVPHPVLSRVVSAILSSAETTDVALSVCGAIHLAACTVARKVRSNKANAAVLFLGNVARTGGGKNAAKNFVSKAMVRAFGYSPASDFNSSSSLFSMLQQSPAAILHLDEFGDKLRHGLKDANGSPIVKGFSALKEIYSQPDDILAPAAFSLIAMSSKQRKDFATTNGPIQKPHLNILAVTTPLQLADAITDASVEGGLINRFLFVTASGEMVENEEFDPVPPEWLIQYMKEVAAELTQSTGGNAEEFTANNPAMLPSVTHFEFCKQSMAVLNDFKNKIKLLGKHDEFMANMSQRWRENAMRMALAIHAFCEPNTRTIDVKITRWCLDYCEYYGKKFAIKTLELAQPSEKYGQRRKAYLQAFRQHPEGVNSDHIGKNQPWRNDAPMFRNALIADMLMSGEIARVIGKKPARGPAPKVWVALQC